MRGHNGVMVFGDHPPYALLGPASCKDCGTLVWYAYGHSRVDGVVTRGLLWWRESSGTVHSCPPAAQGQAARRVRRQLDEGRKVGRHRMLANSRAEWEARAS